MIMQQFLTMTFLTFSLFHFFANNAFASFVNVEIGRTKTSHNYFQLPNDTRNRINLPDDQYATSYRVNGKIDLENNNFLYLVYAPSTTNYSLTSNASFTFDNTDFAADANTEISYKFNGYRLGYFKKFYNTNKLTSWIGGVLNVRDAKIKVRQGAAVDTYRNVGIVPLIGAGFEYALSSDFSFLTHIDSLGFSEGYAYDANCEFTYGFDSNVIGLGYRTFGGGVDNDILMNFARFESFYVSYGREF